MREVKEALAKQIEVKNMGELHYFLRRCEHCSELESRKHIDWSTPSAEA